MKRPLICTPVRAETQEEALKQLEALHQHPRVDMAELWLSDIRDKDIRALLEQTEIPTLCVNKLPEDGGTFSGSDEELVEELLEAARHKACWGISVPTERISEEVARLIRPRLNVVFAETKHKVNFNVEHHYWPPKDKPIEDVRVPPPPNFPELVRVFDRMRGFDADTIKMVSYAKSPGDAAVAFALSHHITEWNKKSIVLAMGAAGADTRLNPANQMMFAPVEPEKATAPGQYTVDELDYIFTERFGLRRPSQAA